MKGLLQEAMGQNPQQAPQGMPQGSPQGEGPMAGPYRKIIEMAKSVIYSQEGAAQLKKQLQMDDPAMVIGSLTAKILQQVVDQIKQAGKNLPEKLITAALIEITAMVAEMADKAGAIPEGQEEAVIRGAAETAMSMLGEANTDVPPEKRQQFLALAQQIFGGQQ